MSDQNFTKAMEDLFTAYKTFTVDLPLVGTRWAFGLGQEKDVTVTAWKGYDASIRAATAAVDSLYRLPLFSTVVSSTANQLLRWQQLGNAASSFALVNVSHGVESPTQTEVRALTERVTRLGTKQPEPLQKVASRVTVNRLRPVEPSTSTSPSAPPPALDERVAA